MTRPVGTIRCWSFSKDGKRCDKEASHEGDHANVVLTEWTDEESWQPSSVVTLTPPLPPVGTVSFNSSIDEVSLPCVACSWPDRATHDDNPYGCRTFV